MHRRHLKCFLCFAAPFFGIASAVAQVPALSPPSAPQPAFNSAPAPAPPPHETFDYGIEWRLITAGKARLEWNGGSGSATAGDVKLHVESAGLVSRLFLVNDDYSALMNPGFCVQSS